MHFSCRSFIGKSGPNSWCQYWENEPDDPSLQLSRGHLFGLIALTSDKDQNTNHLGHLIIDKLNELYFLESKTSPPQQLHQAVTETIKLFPSVKITSLSLAVVISDHLDFYLYGDGQAAIIRQSKISEPIKVPLDQNYLLLSGPINPNDRIFLFTSEFEKELSWISIKKIMIEPQLTTVEDNTLALMSKLSHPDLLGASLIDVLIDNEVAIDSTATDEPVTLPPPPIPDPSSVVSPHPQRPIFVTNHQSSQVGHRQKINIIAGFIVLCALGISITIGFQKNKKMQTEKQYQTLQLQLTKTLSDGFAIKNLNLETATELGKQASDLLVKIDNLKTTNHTIEINQFQSQIQQLLSQTGQADPTQSSAWYDTSFITDNPKYTQLSFQSNGLYLLDPQSGRLDILNPQQKSIRNLTQDDRLKNITHLFTSSDTVYGLTGSSIITINKSLITSILTTTATDATVWNGTLYLLDSANKTILKSTPNSNGFDTPVSWLKSGQSLADNASSIAINGKVWVITDNGQITPYLRGTKDTFTPSQQITATHARNLIVGIDSDILAFIDDGNTIYVYKKNGETKAKYTLDGKTITSITLDEKDNLIYALCSDQKIYKIGL